MKVASTKTSRPILETAIACCRTTRALMKELFPTECRQTKTNVITMANQKTGKIPKRAAKNSQAS